ncbi:hypothetical protein PBI_CAMILLE_9 [Microbacterium phage Camille]|nr:hypothetical protein PBI_CAMILLE_9 [Microbacterium phage Camille]
MSDSIADDVLQHFGIQVEDELKHYGVKGMKWGVVRQRGANGRVTGRVVSEDHVNSRILKGKKTSEMSNRELKELNNRLQLEKTNRELQSRGALQKIKVGTSVAGTILAVGTTITTAYNFVNSPAGKAVISAVKKTLNK